MKPNGYKIDYDPGDIMEISSWCFAKTFLLSTVICAANNVKFCWGKDIYAHKVAIEAIFSQKKTSQGSLFEISGIFLNKKPVAHPTVFLTSRTVQPRALKFILFHIKIAWDVFSFDGYLIRAVNCGISFPRNHPTIVMLNSTMLKLPKWNGKHANWLSEIDWTPSLRPGIQNSSFSLVCGDMP